MQKVLDLLIDYSQNAFIPGRSISDNILLAQELLAGYNQTRLPPRCTIKVDLQKAYDSVQWDFLLEVLKLFKFPTRFIGWIEQCVSSATFSVSLNGSIYGFFPAQEVFDKFHWKCTEQRILSLCFADDILLFCRADIPSIRVIKHTLSEFAELSGLKVNPNKSQIILSRAVQQEKQQMIDILGFQEGSLPVKYLGVPLISSSLTIADCKPLINKLDTRIAGWSHLSLTFAGRAQLIKSVLSTLHSYWASVFILPKGIINIIEAKLRKFLWQGSTGRGCAKVAWDQICRPKEEGGLGFHNIRVINKALMLKHLWKIVQNDRHSIWVDWILHHRLRNNSLWTFNGSTGSWGWKKIIKLRPVLQRGLIYQVGTGTTFKLWQDIWHQQGPLSIAFPRGPEVTGWPLNSFLSRALQHGHWSWPNHNDPDISEIVSQLPLVHQNSPDTIIWRHASGQFSVKFSLRMTEWCGMDSYKAASRALLEELVYYIWIERNRKFTATSSAAESVARRVIEEVRLRILSDEFIPSLQTRTLYRIWKIAWPIGL
ncbi:putative ribonuclease H protein [Sesamum angolense]|uniref:Ribonuclease H protein n=1 Tax=Sesamum angolense TaxID=2727404 RepID=A0AAE1W5H5_9LAMI|nr:putative ribonuclease H protein [Sesamum angolense]